MSDNEDYDITSKIALNISDSDSESESESDFGQENIQDEIMSSDDEEEGKTNPKKKQKATKQAVKKVDINSFPSLELSDDEGDAKDQKEMAAYFAVNNPQAKKAKNGSFASFGLSKFLLSNISKKGFKQPTPIQRKTIPLIISGRDVVGMARTGSGKTAAFTIPMIQHLQSHKIGFPRAIILSPSRELALQTFKQVKEFSRGTDLKSILVIGGDSLEEQFASMSSNPDIVIATPGRFLHLKVEMNLDLKSTEYIVFDEADRLFEMGFAEQLNELLAALPPQRQSLLFSATLPRSLVDFAKAGLTNPILVRLDAETKISEDLQMAFVSTKREEREANLLFLLQEVIKLPLATPEELKKLSDLGEESDSGSDNETNEDGSKKKRSSKKRKRFPPANVLPSPHSTILFVPTKHHVEYFQVLLKNAGFAVSILHGNLNQKYREIELSNFRLGLTKILVVTDVAARGIDVPVLANVINYTLPGSSKIFIHRVGRTARAGNKGWAYSIVSESELPYLLDLELFLGRKILLTSMHEKRCEILKKKQGESHVEPKPSYTDRMVLGSAPRVDIENSQELYDNLLKNSYELRTIKAVAAKGEKLYQRTRQAASTESLKRSREIITSGWDEQHLLFGKNLEMEKNLFLQKLANRIKKETVFEFNKADESLVDFMNKRRKQIAPIQRRAKERKDLLEKERIAGLTHGIEDEILKGDKNEVGYSTVEQADENDLKNAFEDADEVLEKKRKSFRDPNFFMSHYAPTEVIQDKQMSLSNDGYHSSFANDAAKATFDLENDDKIQTHRQTQTMQWDKKHGKYINAKSTDKKFIIGESGQKLPASYRSGKFDAWKKNKSNKAATATPDASVGNAGNRKFVHKKVQTPKLPDKFRDDYKTQKKKVEKAMDNGLKVKGFNKPGQQQELRTTEQIRKQRQITEQKRAKNARPTRPSKRR